MRHAELARMGETKRSRPPQRRPGGRSARVREAVVRATLAELAEVGYAGLSIESIAGRAGVNKTTLYRRWGTRDELVLEVMLATGRERVPIPDTGSLRDDLLAYGRAIIAGSRTPEAEAVVRAVAAAGGHDSGLADASRRFWAERLSLASEIVKRAAARGEIRTPTDPALVVELVIAPIYFRLLMSGEPLNESFAQSLAELVAACARAR